jgi:hypothetical protein
MIFVFLLISRASTRTKYSWKSIEMDFRLLIFLWKINYGFSILQSHFFLIKKSLIFYVELIRLNRMSRQKKKEFLLSQPSGLGEESSFD